MEEGKRMVEEDRGTGEEGECLETQRGEKGGRREDGTGEEGEVRRERALHVEPVVSVEAEEAADEYADEHRHFPHNLHRAGRKHRFGLAQSAARVWEGHHASASLQCIGLCDQTRISRKICTNTEKGGAHVRREDEMRGRQGGGFAACVLLAFLRSRREEEQKKHKKRHDVPQ